MQFIHTNLPKSILLVVVVSQALAVRWSLLISPFFCILQFSVSMQQAPSKYTTDDVIKCGCTCGFYEQAF